METTDLLLGLILGGIGFGYFMYGRRTKNIVARYCGIGLILYPYLASSIWELVAVSAALMLTPRFFEL